MMPHTIDEKHRKKNQLQIHRERLRTRHKEQLTMESHNGISNGVNGTTEVPDVEHANTILEVKSIQNISINSETVQPQVFKPEIVAAEVAPNVLPEIQQKEVAQVTATTQPEEITTPPVEVNVQPSVVKITEEVIAPSLSVATTEVNGVSPVAVDAQPQVILETLAAVTEVENVTGPAVKLPGNQPGSADFHVPLYAINALNRVAREEGFSNYVIDYDRGSKFGDGFVAEIVRAKISGSQLVKGVVQEDSELVVVLKLPPDNKTRREQMRMSIFEREVTVYNEILPMFQKFQSDKGLKPGQGFISFPKCYYASHDAEKDEAVIIMEDIRKKGFKMLNKFKTVDFPHAQAILETVAQFHGLSLAMKDQCPAVFEKFKGLKDAMAEGMVSEMMKTMTVASCEKAVAALEPHEENIKQKLRAFGENIIDIIKKCTDGESCEPYTVINHGDCWINNIMFKYERGIPRHLCLLDWQISRYASPVLDMCYFLYQCTDSELRAQHFDNLVQGYHIALRKQVELLRSDVNQILPFTALLREMKTKAKFALSTALFVIPMLCTPNEELPNLDEVVETMVKGEATEDGTMFQMTSNTELIYKKRMGGIVRDMYKKGYL